LQRPIRISDFTKPELREFKKGRYQLLPYRDRAGTRGRRILSVFPDDEWEKMSSVLRTKIWLYLTYVVGDDIEAQKYGIVVLVWFDTAWNRISKQPLVGAQRSDGTRVLALGIRVSSIHLCTPDTPLYRFRRSILALRLRRERSRVKIHVGKSTELLYTLQSFGLPTDYIPIAFTGKVKVKYVKEWIRLRQLIEDERLARNNTTNTTTWTAQSQSSTMIESPYLDDIIFRNGTSLLSHPGNISLRRLIATKIMHDGNRNGKTTSTRDFVSEIITEIKARRTNEQNENENNQTTENDGNNNGSSRSSSKGGCRFLIWNEKGWWKQVSPENEQINLKISRIVRDTRKLMTSINNNSNNNTKTKSKQQQVHVVGTAQLAPETESPNQNPSIIDLRRDGGSYMFLQSEIDGSQKRQRLSSAVAGGNCFGDQLFDVELFCKSWG